MHCEFLDSALAFAVSRLDDLQDENANGAACTIESLRDVLDENPELANKVLSLVAKKVSESVA